MNCCRELSSFSLLSFDSCVDMDIPSASIELIDWSQSQLATNEETYANEIQRLTLERDKSLEDIDALKTLLTEAVEREGKSNGGANRSTRPVSPSPEIVLPSGYCPLKSKGWAKTQRNGAASTTLKVTCCFKTFVHLFIWNKSTNPIPVELSIQLLCLDTTLLSFGQSFVTDEPIG